MKYLAAFLTLLAGLLLDSSDAQASSAREIDIRTDAALERFVSEVSAGQEFLDSAKGVLVFPRVIKVGFGVGGEYGEGALRVNGETVQYYNTASGSFGFQLGAQSKAIFLLFMNDDSLEDFRGRKGWKVGVDGSVNLIKIGAAGSLDSQNLKDPLIGFVLTNRGLMYNLTLEGTKVTPINR